MYIEHTHVWVYTKFISLVYTNIGLLRNRTAIGRGWAQQAFTFRTNFPAKKTTSLN